MMAKKRVLSPGSSRPFVCPSVWTRFVLFPCTSTIPFAPSTTCCAFLPVLLFIWLILRRHLSLLTVFWKLWPNVPEAPACQNSKRLQTINATIEATWEVWNWNMASIGVKEGGQEHRKYHLYPKKYWGRQWDPITDILASFMNRMQLRWKDGTANISWLVKIFLAIWAIFWRLAQTLMLAQEDVDYSNNDSR